MMIMSRNRMGMRERVGFPVLMVLVLNGWAMFIGTSAKCVKCIHLRDGLSSSTVARCLPWLLVTCQFAQVKHLSKQKPVRYGNPTYILELCGAVQWNAVYEACRETPGWASKGVISGECIHEILAPISSQLLF
jgi:hypothetical protein